MKQRIIFLDWLRVIACLMVMTVHACECVYSDDYTFSFPSESAKYAVFFYQSLVRPTAVPLFLMASAFLLVPVVYSHDIDPHSYDVDPLEEGRVFKEQSLFACKQAAA